jgi:hypothetical protein
VADEIDHLGRKLRHVAEIFEQEDNTAARNLEGMGWVEFETSATDSLMSAPPTPKSSKNIEEKTPLEEAGEVGEVLANLLDLGAVGLTAFSVLSVKHLSGFSGNLLKDALALGGKNLGRTWRAMAKTPIDDLFEEADELFNGTDDFVRKGDGFLGSAALVVGSVCEVVSEIDENWREYDGDPGKMAGGILFDSALGIGGALAGGAAGTFVGGVIGGAIGSIIPIAGTSAGAVIGGKIGGIVGGWLGSDLAVEGEIFGRKVWDGVENVKVGGRELDHTVADTVDRGLETIVDGVASLF